ncbi:TolC family protein [bacterium]|nr:TolC family protein [bacterium]
MIARLSALTSILVWILTFAAPARPQAVRDVRLSVEEAIAVALERNLGLAADRFTPLLAYDQSRADWGQFDPTLSLGYSYTEHDIPESPGQRFRISQAVSFGLEQRDMTGDFSTGLSGLLTPGTRYGVFWDTNRYDTNYFSYFPDSSVEQYNSSLRLELSQPFLKNRGRLINTLRIQQAERAAQESFYAWSERVADVALAAERAYWELVYAERNVAIAGLSLEVAKDLLRNIEAGYRVEMRAKVEVLEAEAQVELRRELLLTARNQRDDAEDALKRLLNWFEGDYLDFVRLVPSSSPEMPLRPLDVEKSFATARARRGVLWAAREAITQASLEQLFARNQLLPDLSLASWISYTGLAPEGKDSIPNLGGLPSFPDRDVSDAWDLMSSGEYYDWSIGLFFTYPLGNRTARVRRDMADKQRAQAEILLADAEQQVLLDVRSRIRQIMTDRQRIESASTAVVLEAERLRISRKSHELGLITSHDVMEVLDDYSSALVRELRAQIDARISFAQLLRVEGTYLAVHNVTLESPFPELPLTGSGEFRAPGPLGPGWIFPRKN